MPVLNPLAWRLIVYGGLILAAMGWTAYEVYGHEERKVQAVKDELATFKGGVAALGLAAEKRTKEENAASLKRKQDADKENADSARRDTALIASLRAAAAKRTNGRFVPSAPATSRSPNLACFDRPELESAIRGLVGEVRGLVDEGSKSALDLNTARIWAAGR